MKLVLLALALLATGCMSQLQTHATVAVAARSLLNQVGTTIDTEAEKDHIAAGGDKADAAHVLALETKWAPVERVYADAEAAERAYLAAIAVSIANKGTAIDVSTPQKLLAAWQSLARFGAEVGIRLPGPPQALVKLAGGAK